MSPSRGCLLALALLAAGCAGGVLDLRRDALPPPAPGTRGGTRSAGAAPETGSRRVQARQVPPDAAAHRAVTTAESLLGATEIVVDGVRYGEDCAALVRASLAGAGVELPAGSARALHEEAVRRGVARRWRPGVGDVAFLSDRPGGPVEHAGLIERVGPGGTVVLLHQTARGVSRVHLDPAHPWQARDEAGRTLNDVLVVGAGRITAGRLLVGYASLR